MKSKPFTLIEIIVATAIFSLVALTAAIGLASVQKCWIGTSLRTEKMKNLLALDRVIDNSFRNAVPFKWRNDNMKEMPVFLGDPEKISFAYIHRMTETDMSGIRFIMLYLDGGNLMAAYRRTPILPWQDSVMATDGEIEREVISNNVEKISLKYAEMDHERNISWYEDWDEEKNPSLPSAILLSIRWKDGSENSWLRRTAGMGKYETYGKKIYVLKNL